MQFICEYKRNFQFEPYLDNLPFEYRSKVSKIRLSDHRLPIEKLRYENIDKSERICDVCNSNEVGDENHYLISCSNDKINESRKDFIQKCIEILPVFEQFSEVNIIKYCLTMADEKLHYVTALFIKEILNNYNNEIEYMVNKHYRMVFM